MFKIFFVHRKQQNSTQVFEFRIKYSKQGRRKPLPNSGTHFILFIWENKQLHSKISKKIGYRNDFPQIRSETI